MRVRGTQRGPRGGMECALTTPPGPLPRRGCGWNEKASTRHSNTQVVSVVFYTEGCPSALVLRTLSALLLQRNATRRQREDQMLLRVGRGVLPPAHPLISAALPKSPSREHFGSLRADTATDTKADTGENR